MPSKTKASFPFLGIKLLKSFTKKELNRFIQFIKSPYFNTDDKLITLFNTLVDNVLPEDAFTDKLQSLTYEIVFEEDTNELQLELKQKKTLAAKLSKLTRLAQKFLVTEGQDKSEINYNEILYKELLYKKQFEMFLTVLSKNKKSLEKKQRKTIDDFEHIYRTELFYLDYLFYTGELQKKNKNNLAELIYHLDIQYILNRLSLSNIINTSKINQNKNYCTIPFDTINDLLQLPQYSKNSNVLVYKSNYEFLKNPSIVGYEKMLSTLELHGNKIAFTELIVTYESLLNFMVNQTKKGIQLSNDKLFNLYLVMDKKNLLLADSFISSIKLKNLVGDSLKVGAIKKAKYFLEKYIPYVDTKHQKSTYNFCLSGIAFYEKSYEKALDHIIQVESINLTYAVNCRFLMMKIYYEIDQHYNERTIRLFRSAEQFFKANKALSTMDKKSYKNFVQILVNLYRIKHHEGKMNISKLQAKLAQQELNSDKKWLLEKMAELK